MAKQRAHLAAPNDVAKKDAAKEEKTQASSTPATPQDKPLVLPPPIPQVKVNLQYPPVDAVTKSACYLRHVPPVYHDHPTFNFAESDFQLRQRDQAFLAEVELPEKDLERVIDCLEKIAHMYRDTQPTFVATTFYNHCDEHLKTLKRSVLDHIVTQFWKKQRIDQKWHVFCRKFWENPDYNEPDLSAAFRKRSEKEKIKTRPKPEILLKKFWKGEKARDQTIKYVLKDLLPNLWQREANK